MDQRIGGIRLMADTGAPWNIPFAEPTDLVRDWPALSEDVADAVAAGLTAAADAGISNLVYFETTTTTSTTAETDQTTPLEVTITPTSLTSRVLVLCTIGQLSQTADNRAANIRIYRDSSSISDDASLFFTGITAQRTPASIMVLDSPNTTSPTTYNLRLRRGGNAGTASISLHQAIFAVEVQA
jgi:hypothetical protein